MTIPDKPLVVNLDTKQLKVKDWRKLARADSDPDSIVEFFAKYTNWTIEEIDELTMDEFGEVSKQFAEAVKTQAVPLPS